MDIFSVLTFIGGLSMFLYGMQARSSSLESASGGKMGALLEKMTNSCLKGVILGTIVTGVIQSSSATTVMVVGFVNAGIMTLSQSVGVIMGANIGTTVTAWIISLVGIQGDSFILQLLKPTSFSPIFAAVGVFLMMSSTNKRRKDIGTILVGFAILMFGMSVMSDSVAPLADDPAFTSIMGRFTNPFLGILVGLVLTAIIQSSSASIGILQALTVTGSITYSIAIPIILGQNIGTCVTALISCAGASKNAKRSAMVHLYFNIIGCIIFLILFLIAKYILNLVMLDVSINAAQIAVFHTIFNIANTVILFPFSEQLAKLATLTIKDKKDTEKQSLLDERFLITPSFAIAQSRKVTEEMAEISRSALFCAMENFKKYDENNVKTILEYEQKLDDLEDQLGNYLVKLSSKGLTMEQSHDVGELLHVINDFERIGDHAVNILESSKELNSKHISFSDEGKEDLKRMMSALTEVLNMSIDSFKTSDVELAKKVEPLEDVIDAMHVELRSRHIERLQKGGCTIELGFIFMDLLANYERISDHCSNIALCIIQLELGSFTMHGYIDDMKSQYDEDYNKLLKYYAEKYDMHK